MQPTQAWKDNPGGAKKGIPKSTEWKTSARASWTPERREAARLRMLGNKRSVGVRKAGQFKHTEATKKKLSESRKGKIFRKDGISAERFYKSQTWARDWHLKRKYHLPAEWYANKLAEQGGHCALCSAVNCHRKNRKGTEFRLSVDHDHSCCDGPVTCGKCVRGLLCDKCNALIDRLEAVAADWPERARAYLSHYSNHRSIQ
jgi:Recombination endonuclease VII/NUMOD3 motif